jgi:hypothetical protein
MSPDELTGEAVERFTPMLDRDLEHPGDADAPPEPQQEI